MLGERSRKKETSRKLSASASTRRYSVHESDCVSFYRKDYSSECIEEGNGFKLREFRGWWRRTFEMFDLQKGLSW